jgi:hypothetical protein
MRINALFGKGATKAAPKATKKTVVKPSGTKTTKGWFGGAGGSQTNLDKWYGEWLLGGDYQGPELQS